MNRILALLGLFLCITLCSAKVTHKRSLVVSTEPPQEENPEDKDNADKNVEPVIPKIYEMRVDTNVSNRYAKTLITSKVRNLNSKAQEATFSIVTPKKAFISGFIMEIDGKKYEAYVQEKEEAKNTYDKAVSSGQSAAHVAVSARDSNKFTVSVNVEPESKATFYLRYEELLVRKNDKYDVVLNIHPGQPVKNLEVQVNIAESRPLKFVKVPSLRSGNEIFKNQTNIDPEADITNVNETSAVVTFKPDIIKQKLFASSLGGKEEDGLSGQFVVQYDVARDPQGGEVLVDGGYFVHFFAPEDLSPLKKQVVFVLDTSGSMGGPRIAQLKEAMNSILDELNPEDVFSIVEFSSVVKVWNVPTAKVTYQGEDPDRSSEYGSPGSTGTTPKPKEQLEQIIPPSFEADEDNIKKAKEVIENLKAFGYTDIQSALKVGLQIVARNKDPKAHQPIIVFLTDGEPTIGEYNTSKIISTITELNTGEVPIFALSFGDGADRNFLQKLSLKNLGFARHIYEAADAYLQLQDFYQQISSPLLSNVSFKYVDNVMHVTKSKFPIYFGGGELFVTGVLNDADGFKPQAVECIGVQGPTTFVPKVYQAAGSLERLWAYLTVKQLLEQREVAEDKKGPTQDALRLALKYSFVTDVSSLVVVKPNATKSAVDTEDAAKSDRNYPGYGGLALHSGGSAGLARPMYFSGVPQNAIGGGKSYSYSFMKVAPQGPSFYQGAPGLPGPPPPAPVPYAVGDSGGGLIIMPLSASPSRFPQHGSGGGGLRDSSVYGGRSRPHFANLGLSGFSGRSGYSSGGGFSSGSLRGKSYVSGTIDLSSKPSPSYASAVFDEEAPIPFRLQEPVAPVPVADFDSDSEGDRIFGGQNTNGASGYHAASGSSGYLSTTPLFLPLPQTSTIGPLVALQPVEELEQVDNNVTTKASDDIFSKIPWLKDALSKNQALILESGTYTLGLNETAPLKPDCLNSLNDLAGTCTLLQECPQIHKDLTDLTTYKKYFCDLNNFAGVCCPKPVAPDDKGH